LAKHHTSKSPRCLRRWALIGLLGVSLPAAARAIECPTGGAGDVANVLRDWKNSDFPLDADDVATIEKIDAIVRRVRKDQPGVSFPSLVNSLTAAYCPIVAKQRDRTDAQKRAQLVRFDQILEQRIAAVSALADDQILAQVPLSESVMRGVTAAAATAHETPAQWMADVVAKAVVPPK
jgi:hypothetical protein